MTEYGFKFPVRNMEGATIFVADLPESMSELSEENVFPEAIAWASARRKNMPGVDFSDLRLAHHSFTEINFEGSRFCRGNLCESDFYYCGLNRANFNNAILCKARFQSSSLQYAVFGGAYLYDACFTDADILGIVADPEHLGEIQKTNQCLWSAGKNIWDEEFYITHTPDCTRLAITRLDLHCGSQSWDSFEEACKYLNKYSELQKRRAEEHERLVKMLESEWEQRRARF